MPFPAMRRVRFTPPLPPALAAAVAGLSYGRGCKTFLDYEADFGGANRVLVAVMAKDGNMYLLNPTNLGGMGGHTLTFKVSSGGAMAVKTSPTAYKTAKGTHYVFSTDSGAVCPGGGGGMRARPWNTTTDGLGLASVACRQRIRHEPTCSADECCRNDCAKYDG